MYYYVSRKLKDKNNLNWGENRERLMKPQHWSMEGSFEQDSNKEKGVMKE